MPAHRHIAPIFDFVGIAAAWFATIVGIATAWYRGNLKRFWERFCDLRLEIQIALQTPKNRTRLIDLASQLDGLQGVMPLPIRLYMLHIRGYDLRSAVRALKSFSLPRSFENRQIAELRVLVQKCLRLPIDPKDREFAERMRRYRDAGGFEP